MRRTSIVFYSILENMETGTSCFHPLHGLSHNPRDRTRFHTPPVLLRGSDTQLRSRAVAQAIWHTHYLLVDIGLRSMRGWCQED